MKHLSEKEYWDSIYQKKEKAYFSAGFWSSLKSLFRNYSNYLIWEKIFPKYLIPDKNKKIIEIGCAPGKNLIHLNERFGYIPCGVEYSHDGVVITRKNFTDNNITGDVIEADFFGSDFQDNYREFFDFVYSKGFIEHFDDPKKVVDQHANILKKGGIMIIQIPNLSGVNFYLSKFFNIKSHNLHNISIMNEKSFKNLFDNKEYEILFLDYVGLFNIGLFNTSLIWKEKLRLLIYYFIQQPLNLIFRIFSHIYTFESRYSSPYLLAFIKKI